MILAGRTDLKNTTTAPENTEGDPMIWLADPYDASIKADELLKRLANAQDMTTAHHRAAAEDLLACAAMLATSDSYATKSHSLSTLAAAYAAAANFITREPAWPGNEESAPVAPALAPANSADQAMSPQPNFCEWGDRVRHLKGRHKGTVIDLTRAAAPENDMIRVRWDLADNDQTHFEYRRNQLEILSRYNDRDVPDAAARDMVAAMASRYPNTAEAAQPIADEQP